MGKTRVYELAQKLGLENKDVLEKLQGAGVGAKSHMSVLEDEDLRKFEASSAPKVETVEKVEEERINPGIIRRRRKEVPPPAVKAEATEPPEATDRSPASDDTSTTVSEMKPKRQRTKKAPRKAAASAADDADAPSGAVAPVATDAVVEPFTAVEPAPSAEPFEAARFTIGGVAVAPGPGLMSAWHAYPDEVLDADGVALTGALVETGATLPAAAD